MNVKDIRDRVARIARVACTHSFAAHTQALEEEAQLYADLLDAIAVGVCKSPRTCAREARRARAYARGEQ